MAQGLQTWVLELIAARSRAINPAVWPKSSRLVDSIAARRRAINPTARPDPIVRAGPQDLARPLYNIVNERPVFAERA